MFVVYQLHLMRLIGRKLRRSVILLLQLLLLLVHCGRGMERAGINGWMDDDVIACVIIAWLSFTTVFPRGRSLATNDMPRLENNDLTGRGRSLLRRGKYRGSGGFVPQKDSGAKTPVEDWGPWKL